MTDQELKVWTAALQGVLARSSVSADYAARIADDAVTEFRKRPNEELARKMREIAEKLAADNKPLDEIDADVIRKHLWELYK
jgi:hypothetical protein